MELTLSVLRCPDAVVPEQRQVPGGDYRLGRGTECDWVLPDPDRLLSKQHCVLEFRSGGWEVRDTSTNGTFVNHATQPVGREQTAVLNDGDRIRLGAYEIEIRVAQAGAGWGGAGMPGGQAAPGWETPAPPRPEWNAQPAPREVGGAWEVDGWEQSARPTREQAPMAPRVAGDPFANGPDQPSGFNAPPPGGGLPGVDPFAAGGSDPFASEAMPDHRPSTSDAFLPPRPMQQTSGIPDDWDLDLSPKAPVNQGPPPPAPKGPAPALPDDWDLDLSPPTPAARPAAQTPPPHPVPPGPVPPTAPVPGVPLPGVGVPSLPTVPPNPEPPRTPPPAQGLQPRAAAEVPEDFDFQPQQASSPAAAPHGDEADPFAEDGPAAESGRTPQAPRVVATVPPGGEARPRENVAAPVEAAPVAAQPPAAAGQQAPLGAGGGAGPGLAVFLEGAGLGTLPVRAAPEEALRSLGAAFAAAIAGIRALLIARADVKREFRIEQTMLRAGANNPIKFSATDEQAIAGLIGAGPERGVAALQETVADLTAHQVAALAATQAAARALLGKLAPAAIEGSEGGGGLFGGREKKNWEAYKKLHQQVLDQFDDDFDSAFGKEFARAYEMASRK